MSQHPLIAITGGIGAGKSVVSHILRILGYPVFDCDTEARILMEHHTGIKEAIRLQVCEEAVANGIIDRRKLAEIVFADDEKRLALNSIVHDAVGGYLQAWHRSRTSLSFVETALMYTSGLDKVVDAEWRVIAPVDLRIERVIRRNGLTADEIRSRIASQHSDENPTRPHSIVNYIVNDGRRAVLPQIFQTLATTASIRSPRESENP